MPENEEPFNFKSSNKLGGKKSSSLLEPSNFYNIWKKSPSFRDMNTSLIFAKGIIIISLITVLTIISWFEFKNGYFTFIFSLFTTFLFVIGFKDEFLRISLLSTFRLKKLSKLDPFKEVKFWQVKQREDIIFYTNQKDLISVGLKIFKISTVPENVNPNFNGFFRYLNSANVPFTYQVVQAPLINYPVIKKSLLKNISAASSLSSVKTEVYFCFYYDFKGILNTRKLNDLINTLEEYVSVAKAGFKANFHHFKISELNNLDLTNAIRTVFIGTDIPLQRPMNLSVRNFTITGVIRIVFLAEISIIFILFLLNVGVNMYIAITGSLVIIMGIVSFFWKSIFFTLSRSVIKKEGPIRMVDPFQDIRFYWLGGTPNTVYSLVYKKMLIGTKIFNIIRSNPPLFGFQNKPLSRPDGFFQTIIPLKIPFIYTATIAPMLFSRYLHESLDYLNERNRNSVLKLDSVLDQENYMSMRGGIWRGIFTISVNSYKHITHMSVRNALEVEVDLLDKTRQLGKSYEASMRNYKIALLNRERLVSAFLLSFLKNKFFRSNGSNLVYLLHQGKTLTNLIDIFPQLKKGLEVKIASEFNTPLQLDNYIVLGNTINTEVLEPEVKAGFTLEQVKNLLFVNGSEKNKELALIKTVIELVKQGTPSIIFDHTGLSTKLLTYFKGTVFEEQLAFFKLGKSFTIDLIRSDLPYDTNNPSYLELVADAYSLVFQKDERIMEAFKRSILKLEKNFDINSIKLDIETNPEWNTNPISDSLKSLFDDLSGQEMAFFVNSTQKGDSITAIDFINDDTTVVIDLSILSDVKKKTFASFVITAKILHAIIHSGALNLVGYGIHEKILVIPHIDTIFESYYLEKTNNYGMIDKFLGKFFQRGFGVISSANKASYLHDHAFSFFNNIATFRIYQKQDASQISYIMNFRKVHGSGIYSSRRNETFQVNYMSTMQPYEVVVKRSDINQPFPVELELKEIENLKVASQEEIDQFMKDQGYDLALAEKVIQQQASKTLFEKDFEIYSGFIEEVIQFLNALKTVDKIGNLHEKKIKEELKKFIYPKASKIVKKKNLKHKINKMRNEIFSILVEHDYLVERHHLEAGGSESLRTTYSVGEKYENALQDYYESKSEVLTSIPEAISIESPELNDVSRKELKPHGKKMLKSPINQYELALGDSLSLLVHYSFRIYRAIKTNDIKSALFLEKEGIYKFLEQAFKKTSRYEASEQELFSFTRDLAMFSKFQWARTIKNLFNQCQDLSEERILLGKEEVLEIFDQIKSLQDELNVFNKNFRIK